MSTMYCECEVKSVTKSGSDLNLSVVPVGAFKLSFRNDDKRIEYALFSDNMKLSSSGKNTEAMLFVLDDGRLNAKYPDAETNTIESAMLIAAAAARSKVLIGVDETKSPIEIKSVEMI